MLFNNPTVKLKWPLQTPKPKILRPVIATQFAEIVNVLAQQTASPSNAPFVMTGYTLNVKVFLTAIMPQSLKMARTRGVDAFNGTADRPAIK